MVRGGGGAEWRGTNTVIQLQSSSWKHHPSLDPTSVTRSQGCHTGCLPRVFLFLEAKRSLLLFFWPKMYKNHFLANLSSQNHWIFRDREGSRDHTIQPPLFTDKEADRCQDSLQGHPTNQWKDGLQTLSLPSSALFTAWLQGDLEKHWWDDTTEWLR